MAGPVPPFEPRPGPGFRARENVRARRSRHFAQLPVRTIIPNSLTVLALCAGLTAIRFAIEARYEAAVAAIIIASIFDALDGRIARMLQGSTKFGAELDSLTDFVNFGIAPVVILYLWSLGEIGGIGWIAVLGFAVCCALRLARFKVALEDPDKPVWAGNYFVGVPAPAAAGLVMLPLYLSFVGVDWIKDVPLLIEAFMGQISEQTGIKPKPISDEAMAVLQSSDWPGNVRELRNVVERAIYRWDDWDAPIGHAVFDPFDSPWKPVAPPPRADQAAAPPAAPASSAPDFDSPDDLRAAVDAHERTIVEHALGKHRWNQRQTAKALGLTYDQLRHCIKKHALADDS